MRALKGLALTLAVLSALGGLAHAYPLSLHDPRVVRALEDSGLSFAERMTGKKVSSNAEIASALGYETIVRTIKRDLARIERRDKKAGVGTRYSHRLFDARWLESPRHRFELVGLVNRIDRMAFSAEGCGEIRLVYRLAYSDENAFSSRLPMTVNLVYRQDGKDCADLGARWVEAIQAGSATLVASPSSGGVFSESSLSRARLKSVELNLQSVRWPATVHPSLGGHAEYLMRVFVPDGQGLKVGTLENTPDVRRLERSPRLKAALLAWINHPNQRDAIEAGTYLVPEKFLAKKVTNVTPRSLARLANRPFRQLFDASELHLREGREAEHLLRSLDARTCGGCHQSRSLAGFHLPGEDPLEQGLDALAVGRSPHFIEEQAFRGRFFSKVLAGERPLMPREHPELGRFRGLGARCSLDGTGGAPWSCAQGLTCAHVDDLDIGVCARSVALGVGEACEPGELQTRSIGHRDRRRAHPRRDCRPGLHCEATSVGFPGGMCSGACSLEEEGSICGSIALLHPFNRCVAKGEPFEACLVEHTRPATLAHCDPETPCRDDYLCARIKGSRGGCIPPYFLFQMRVDGH